VQLDKASVEVAENRNKGDIDEVARKPSKMLKVFDQSTQEEDPEISDASRYYLCLRWDIFGRVPEKPGQKNVVAQ